MTNILNSNLSDLSYLNIPGTIIRNFHQDGISSSVNIYTISNHAVLFDSLCAEYTLIEKFISRSKEKNIVTAALFKVNTGVYITYRGRDLNLNSIGGEIFIYYISSEESNVIDKVVPFLLKAKDSNLFKSKAINIVTQNQHGFSLNSYPLNKPFDIDISTNYPSKFASINNTIINDIKNKDKGLYLLHGHPGTGKTSYIKYLMGIVEREVVYIPTGKAYYLEDASFIDLLYENSGSLMIIEDAESLLQKRDSRESNNVGISNLLNITDGLLTDVLDIHIICTFNCKVDNIDAALLRKGRLSLMWEFQLLNWEESKRLAEKLGIGEIEEKESYSLTEIYNYNEDNLGGIKSDKRKTIGF